jgi:RsiW-degrading membrane proteinase PrsW (M82 family)
MTGRWAWLLVLLGGLVAFEAVRETLVATGNEALVPTLLLVGALVMPATFVTLLAGRELVVTVDAATIAVTALAGGVVGVVLAGFVEFETLRGLGLGARIGVAVIEEAAKLAVPAALLLLRRARGVRDGLILGVASGAGFAALETMGYAFTTIVDQHGDLTELSHLLLIRGFWSPAGHMAWTGLIAAALYYAAERHFSARSTALLAGGVIAALTLHTAWDSLQTPWAYAVIAVLGLGALATVVHCEDRPGGRQEGAKSSFSDSFDSGPALASTGTTTARRTS